MNIIHALMLRIVSTKLGNTAVSLAMMRMRLTTIQMMEAAVALSDRFGEGGTPTMKKSVVITDAKVCLCLW